ncbi:MAG TPA: sigma-70 family RNA polymerase sigma factor [Longimicrobiaceae bacterium]|jgi:RNA polymerase sigma-70 factor (ECF subfamily)
MLTIVQPTPPPSVLERAAGGDAAALAELYGRYGEAVHRLAFRLTGSAAGAEDVLQDVFVGLPEALRSYAGRGSLEGWIRRVAARTALMRMRGERRRREVALDPREEPAARSDPGAVVERTAIERALAALPDGLRAVFVLREVEGYSHAEIAGLLGIRPGTSEVRLFRAKKLLRTLLRSSR